MAPSGDGSAASMRPNRQSRRNAKKRAARSARAAAADESDVALSDGADTGAPESSADEAHGTNTHAGAHLRGKVHVRGAGGAHGKINPFLPPPSDASDTAPSESEASESDSSLSRADAQSARKRKAEKHQARRRTAATKKKKKPASSEATLSQVLDEQQQQSPAQTKKKPQKKKKGGGKGGKKEEEEGDCCCYCMIIFLGLCVVLTVGLRIAGEQWRPDEDEWNEHYTVLGLEPGATQREIKRAFRQLSVRKHPDKSAACKRDPDSAACTRVREEFMRMTQAHDALYEGKRRNNAATWYNQEDKASYMPE